MNKLVSIIVPCYNQAKYLQDALNSVFSQTYPHWECILINDGSTDNTAKIGKEWSQKDNRFIYIEKKNGGLSSARNVGLKVAKGDFVQFLDADDFINYNKFELQLKAFQDNVDIVVSDYLPFDDLSKKRVDSRYLSPFLNSENYKSEIIALWETQKSIPCHCLLIKKNLIENNNLSFENLPNHEDWVFWVKIFYFSKGIVNLEQILAYYRIRANSMCSDRNLMLSGFIVATKHLIGFFKDEESDYFRLLVIKKLKEIKSRNHNLTIMSKIKIFIKKQFIKIKTT